MCIVVLVSVPHSRGKCHETRDFVHSYFSCIMPLGVRVFYIVSVCDP